MDTCWSAKNWTRKMYCTKLLHHTYTKIWTLSCSGISEHHGIFLERKNTRPCIKVGCLRPAVTFSLLLPPAPKNRPVLDLTVPLGVQFLREMKEDPPHLRPAPPPRAMSPLSNRRLSRAVARRHHSGPWFLWFRWYWNNKYRRNIHKLVHPYETSEIVASLCFQWEL